jgi:uncharacterized protein YuzE
MKLPPLLSPYIPRECRSAAKGGGGIEGWGRFRLDTTGRTRRTCGEEENVQAMNKPRMMYFSEEDVLHLVISEEQEANSIELSPNITAELNAKGELIGIEILDASVFMRDSVMSGVQAKVLNLIPAAGR